MAHASQLEYVKLLLGNFPTHFRNARILEVGSLDINGSIRALFPGCDYVGLDVAAGDGVDVVCEGQKYDAPDNSFDVVISCEVMEHNPFWIETFRNMIRCCRPGGLVVMTCASTGRPEHGTARTDPYSSPLTVKQGWSYYKNLTEKDFRRAIDPTPSVTANRFWTDWNHYDLLFAGIKGAASPADEVMKCWENAARATDEWIARENGGRVHRYRAAMAATFGDYWFKPMNRLAEILNWLHRPR